MDELWTRVTYLIVKGFHIAPSILCSVSGAAASHIRLLNYFIRAPRSTSDDQLFFNFFPLCFHMVFSNSSLFMLMSNFILN